MLILKDSLAIVVVAGVLAAGVTAYMPVRTVETAVQPPEVVAGRPAASGALTSDMSQARARLREGLATAYGRGPTSVATLPPPQAVLPEPPAHEVVAATIEAGTPIVVASDAGRKVASAETASDEEAVGLRRSSTRPAGAGTDPAWVPTPRPEIIEKADALFDNGDVAGARLWLEVALEAGDADAAYRLAETYDPAVLREWRIVGVASDVTRAQALYERALNGGVAMARRRLERLPR